MGEGGNEDRGRDITEYMNMNKWRKKMTKGIKWWMKLNELNKNR